MIRLKTILLITILSLALPVFSSEEMCSLNPEPETPSCGGGQSKPFTLYYWAVRGLGQPVRELAEFLNLEYNEVRYGDEHNPKEDYWASKEKALEDDWALMNLPYIHDSETGERVSESDALMIWLVNKSGQTSMLPS